MTQLQLFPDETVKDEDVGRLPTSKVKMKPLISYYGGKQRIASKILPHFPKHSCYCEPFAGGTTLLLAKPRPIVANQHHYREVINDTNRELITFYRVAIEQPDELENKILGTLYSQSDHAKSKAILKESQDYDDLTIAWAFFVNINQSFSNKLLSSWGTNTLSSSYGCVWDNRKSRLKSQLKKIKNVIVACEDALSCIKRWDSPQMLFYCDPPYPSTDQGHYRGYSLQDWKNLCDLLDNIQGSYVVSNYPQEIEPISATRKIKINAKMSSAKNSHLYDTKRTEILWVCDRSDNIRSDIRKIIDSYTYD